MSQRRSKKQKSRFLNIFPTSLKTPSGKGKSLILFHVGNEEGFIKNGRFIFKSKPTEDYQQEIDSNHYLKYFKGIYLDRKKMLLQLLTILRTT